MIDATTRDLEVRVGGPAEVWPDQFRVLQFLTGFELGGTERQVVNLTRGLDPARFALHFGCLHEWGDLRGEITGRGIPITEYPVRRLYDLRAWRQRARFFRYLRRERIQLVHAYNFYANVFAVPVARLAGIPVVASIRDTGGYLTPVQLRAQRVACRLAHRITVNAEAVRHWLMTDGYDAQKVVVIHNGVDLSRFPRRRADGRIRHELGISPQMPVVAVLSRLIRLKGLEHFLEAAALVAGRVPDVRFLIVGDRLFATKEGTVVRDVAYRNELEQHAARLGLDDRVVFTGFRLDVPELLSDVAVSVLPSVGGEGLSNAVLEAMAAGVPVVATTVGGNAEAIEHGVTGLLVPPRDAGALANAICYLLEHRDAADQFGAAGRERVVRYFSLERCARAHERLYLDLLAAPARRPGPEGAMASGAEPANAVPTYRDPR